MLFQFFSATYVVVVLFILSLPIAANARTDDLHQEIKSAFDKAYQYQHANIDSMQLFIDIALAGAKKTGVDSLLAESYQLSSLARYHQGDLKKALLYLDSAEVHYKKAHMELALVDIHKERASIVEKQGSLDIAVTYYLEARQIYEKHDMPLMVARINGHIGNIFFRLKAYEKSISYYSSSMATLLKDSTSSNSNIGGTFMMIGSAFKAIDELDSALYYYDLSDIYFTKADNDYGIAMLFNSKGGLFEKLNEHDSAIKYYQISLDLKNEIGVKRGIASTSKNLGALLRVLGQNEEALQYLDSGYEVVTQSADSFLIRDYFLEYAALYKALKQYEKSADFFQRFYVLDQHLSSTLRNEEISEIVANYEKEKQERKIAELELVNQQAANRFNIIFFVSILLIVLIGFVIIYAISKQKATRLLSGQNQQIRQALHDKEMLIKEVHHRVKNNLQTVSSLLKLQSSRGNHAVKNAIQAGQNRVTAMAIIHQMLYQDDNLISVHLDQYIDKLVSSILDSFKLTEQDVHLNIKINPMQVEVDSAISIGLIVNELITNSLKYAFDESHERELSVVLFKKQDSLELTVRDNGAGFPPEFKIEEQKSFGLNLVNMIASKLEATVDIYNQAGATIQMNIKNYTLVA
ncbi:MAG: histidine kinase dimerization/phosphoacceptor domain -containing protein [Bacteroidota bacterium]